MMCPLVALAVRTQAALINPGAFPQGTEGSQSLTLLDSLTRSKNGQVLRDVHLPTFLA